MRRRNRFDELFTVLFMLLAIGAIISFFTLGRSNPTYLILGGAALLLRIAQYIMRMI